MVYWEKTKNMILILPEKKRFLQTGLLAFGALAVYVFFPADNRLNMTVQGLALSAVFFVLLPIFCVKFILHEPLSSLGFQGSERRFGAIAVPLAVIPTVSIWYMMLRFFPITESFPISAAAKGSFLFFLLYEVVLVGVIAFFYEVFFRGFVLILWLRRAGLWAIFFQSFLFAAFLAVSGLDISWKDVPLLLASLGSGFVASHTRSVPYSWLSAWLILFLSDVIILVLR